MSGYIGAFFASLKREIDQQTEYGPAAEIAADPEKFKPDRIRRR